MKFTPLFNNILVQRLEDENKTAGGIIIPDTAKEKPSRGKVVAIGLGQITETGSRTPVQVKEGNTILFSKWGGTEVKIDGTDYVIMKDTDVLGIIE